MCADIDVRLWRLSYDALREIAGQKLLEHMTDSVVDEYSEQASEELY
jgi:CRP-like cAMP-binding protein